MQDLTTMTPPEHPGLEGSLAACAVLVALHKHPEGLTLADLGSLLGLHESTLIPALIGLSERRRVKSVSRTKDARWFTMFHARAIQEVRP